VGAKSREALTSFAPGSLRKSTLSPNMVFDFQNGFASLASFETVQAEVSAARTAEQNIAR
jgi:hypothetical protein